MRPHAFNLFPTSLGFSPDRRGCLERGPDSDALCSPETVLDVFRFPTTSAEEGATYPPFSIETLMTIAAVGAVVINAAGAAP